MPLFCYILTQIATVQVAVCDNGFQDILVVARAGQTAETGESLGSFRLESSINDLGVVAFGTNGGINALVIGQGTGVPQIISTARQAPAFSPLPQINNANQIVGRETVSSPSATLIRIWNSSPSPYTIATGSGDPILSHTLNLQNPEQDLDFGSVLLPSIANDGGVSFVGLSASGSVGLYYNPAPNPTSGPSTPEVFLTNLTGGGFRPMAADGGRVLTFNDAGGSRALNVYRANGATQTIASVGTSWASLGAVPGISDNGLVVTFAGELTFDGAAALNLLQPNSERLTPGIGIFASIDTGSGRIIQRIAGRSGNGYLEPGEKWSDTNKDGIVDVGEDVGGFQTIDMSARVGVNRSTMTGNGIASSSEPLYRFVFLGTEASGQTGVFTGIFSGSTSGGIIAQPSVVAKAGQVIPGLPNALTSLSLYDPVNNTDQIAFTAGNGDSVIRVTRNLDPLRQFQAPFGASLYAPIELGVFIGELQANPNHRDAKDAQGVTALSLLEPVEARGQYNVDAVGCFLTSFSMAVRQLGTSYDTPVEIHAKLEGTPGGITPIKGILRYLNVEDPNDARNGTFLVRPSGIPIFDGADPNPAMLEKEYGVRFKETSLLSEVRLSLGVGNPVLLNLRNGKHWILATHIADDGRIETIDPGASNNDRAYTDFDLLSSAGFKKARIVRAGQVSPSLLLTLEAPGVEISPFAVFQTQSPVEVLITSPSGLRLGFDVRTSANYAEIPESSYFPEYPIGDVDDLVPYTDAELAGMAPFLPHIGFINAVEKGEYRIELFGVESGAFTFSLQWFDSSGGVFLFEKEGLIEKGQTLTFNASSIPEPATITLLSTGVLYCCCIRRRIFI